MTQPSLHDLSVVLQAPIQCWSDRDGHVATDGAQGVYCGDERVARALVLAIQGHELEHLQTDEPGGPAARYRYVVHTPELGVDPQVLLERHRRATGGSLAETLTLISASTEEQQLNIAVRLTPDNSLMTAIKAGKRGDLVPLSKPVGHAASWSWRDADTTARLTAHNGRLTTVDSHYELRWSVIVRPRDRVSVGWSLELADAAAPFVAADGEETAIPELPAGHAAAEPLNRLLRKGIGDLNALRMAEADDPTAAFLAAGSPWYLTLFGRDSLISARLLLPHDPALAASTLRVLANRQGQATNPGAAEQPGKILHEVRRAELDLHHSRQDADGTERAVVLPPEYYGTIDATLLWILLLADVARTGANVNDLLPALGSALGWLREHADADGDGFLEYFDESGTGLSNQGWKDSADSIRRADGERAEGPIALVEVQGYAHAAALAGARLLQLHGDAGEAHAWTVWAAELATRFRERFWVSDELGPYPALALDARKRPVDGVSSNIGHLLGTGILRADEARTVVHRLLHPSMASGYGVRTLSTTNAGYWPLSYHVGSVWTHDTAVIIDGMLRDGFDAEAAELAAHLLRAADGFDARLPELFGGQPADEASPPVPYPASCRPQAWAAASAITIARAIVPGWLES